MKFYKSVFFLAVLIISAGFVARIEMTNRNQSAWGVTLSDQSLEWKFQFYRLMSHAQVSRIFKDNLKLSDRESAHLATVFLKYCKIHGLDPAFVMAVVQVESNFRPKVVSSAGAVGLMQVMPQTARYLWMSHSFPGGNLKELGVRDSQMRSVAGITKALKTPRVNIIFGMAYLGILKKIYQNQFSHILAAYNAGPGRVKISTPEAQITPLSTRPYIAAIRATVPYWRTYGDSNRSYKEERVRLGLVLKRAPQTDRVAQFNLRQN